MTWTSLHAHSYYSILDGLASPDEIAERCAELGMDACAITDHGSLAGVLEFEEACKKKNIKNINGIELYVSREKPELKSVRKLDHLVVLAKNQNGWKSLMKAATESNRPNNYYYKPRLDLDGYAEHLKDCIGFSGHLGSTIAASMFDEDGKLFSDAEARAEKQALIHQDIFGKGNFFLEVQKVDPTEKGDLVADIVRSVARKTGIPTIGTGDAHFAWKKQVQDHRVVLAIGLRTTLSKIAAGGVGLDAFFNSDNFYIKSEEEVRAVYTDEEIAHTKLIADMCEAYSIKGKPSLPKFVEGDENEALAELCRNGWRNKIQGKINNIDTQTYVDRVKYELQVLREANLAGYFLIVHDYVAYAKRQGWLVGSARGSVCGSLVAYLTDITTVDPIPYNLLFERFYNSGRNTPGNISFPDIDVDFPSAKRPLILEYIKDKFGRDRAAQICTYGTLQGRSAISEVLTVNGAASHHEIKRMTKAIPDKAKVQDKMAETGEKSIIRWSLKNLPDKFAGWAYYDGDGELRGDYASYFEQAIRLEGVVRSYGKHAAGIVISSDPLVERCPLIKESNGDELITMLDMDGVEKCGILKMDCLAIDVLDKLEDINNLLTTGEFADD